MGRRPQRHEHVRQAEGSEEDKLRAEAVIRYVGGSLPLAEAMEMSGLGESQFHSWRVRIIQGSVDAARSLPPGRPPLPRPDPRIAQLEGRVRGLEQDLAKERARTAVLLGVRRRSPSHEGPSLPAPR